MKQLIHLIAQSLVDCPEAVNVADASGDRTTVVALRVAKNDTGKIIGKQGCTAQAIRTIVSTPKGPSAISSFSIKMVMASLSFPKHLLQTTSLRVLAGGRREQWHGN